MKEKLIQFWHNTASPFLKDETEFRNWVILAIALVSFVAGAIVF